MRTAPLWSIQIQFFVNLTTFFFGEKFEVLFRRNDYRVRFPILALASLAVNDSDLVGDYYCAVVPRRRLGRQCVVLFYYYNLSNQFQSLSLKLALSLCDQKSD